MAPREYVDDENALAWLSVLVVILPSPVERAGDSSIGLEKPGRDGPYA